MSHDNFLLCYSYPDELLVVYNISCPVGYDFSYFQLMDMDIQEANCLNPRLRNVQYVNHKLSTLMKATNKMLFLLERLEEHLVIRYWGAKSVQLNKSYLTSPSRKCGRSV